MVFLHSLIAEEAPDDFRYQVEVLDQSIRQPMELELAPDGRVFVNDFKGGLYLIDPKSDEQPIQVAQLEVFNEQENGFLGFALDPQFEKNHWIYCFYSPPDYSGQRLSRFRIDDDQLRLDSEKVMFEFEEQRRQCCHHAGSVEFAPDGCLLISTGDNTFPGAPTGGSAPIDERPDNDPWDAQKSSANTHDLRGKILRIRPTISGGYEIPEGNLFPEDGSDGRAEIFVMGCRNPWRMSVDERTGFVYWGEVGPDAGGDTERGPRGYDELNQAKAAGNFGWPYFVGNNFAYAEHDFASSENGPRYDPLQPINNSPNNTGRKVLPPAQPALIYWPYGASTGFPSLVVVGARLALDRSFITRLLLRRLRVSPTITITAFSFGIGSVLFSSGRAWMRRMNFWVLSLFPRRWCCATMANRHRKERRHSVFSSSGP